MDDYEEKMKDTRELRENETYRPIPTYRKTNKKAIGKVRRTETSEKVLFPRKYRMLASKFCGCGKRYTNTTITT